MVGENHPEAFGRSIAVPTEARCDLIGLPLVTLRLLQHE